MADKAEKKTCFVIGPIGAEGSEERTKADWLLKAIIKPALEEEGFGYKVTRADEIAEPGSITDQVIAAVIDAKLVVADLTGRNPNAFYELAVRHMEERPVIHMAMEGESLPFDIRDYRAIFYRIEHPDDIEAAKASLRNQVRAVEAQDYEVSNPVIKARGHKELARSSEPKDKLLADMIESLRRLEAGQEKLEYDREVEALARTFSSKSTIVATRPSGGNWERVEYTLKDPTREFWRGVEPPKASLAAPPASTETPRPAEDDGDADK